MRNAGSTTIAAAAIVVVLAAAPPTRRGGERFFGSLRLEKPQPVAATAAAAGAAPAGSSANRQLQDAVAGMVSHAPVVSLDEPDQSVTTTAAAAAASGFAVRLVRSRPDPPAMTVIGARTVDLPVDRVQLRTILDEANERRIATPASLDGTSLQIHTPRAMRVQWGNCPAPAARTIQGQLQGPPRPSADNASCLMLTESPPASVRSPAALDVAQLVDIGLELAGMSPTQERAFQTAVDWRSALALSLPRGIRSYDMVTVRGGPAMLINTGGRRGPTYALVWRDGSLVYVLAGYGNPGDAVALANSVS